MSTYVKRPYYLQKLIVRRNNGQVKVINGPRRSGKSFLLETIYRDYLVLNGVPETNIIIISFDVEDLNTSSELFDREILKQYLYGKIVSETEEYYVFLDEIQEVDGFERIVNGLNKRSNVDVYITGSNSKFLSSDINTVFRGRGDEVEIMPFSFKEFCQDRMEPLNELWKEYYTYGGLPALREMKTTEQKVTYLRRLWNKTYLSDVVERHHIKNREALESIVDVLCSAVGSLTNTSRITNILKSVRHIDIEDDTVLAYIGYLQEAFLFSEAKRYNIKGHRYYENIKKYYAVDMGLRNSRLNFRQLEVNHIMENVIYNELVGRGYLVDVGIIEHRKMENGVAKYVQYEVDFIATDGMEKYYIQSAFELPSDEKRVQELNSLKRIDDSFQKIVIVGSDIMSYMDDDGIRYMGLFQFLKNEKII